MSAAPSARDIDRLVPDNTPDEVRARAALPGRVPKVDPTLNRRLRPVQQTSSASPASTGTSPATRPQHRLVVIGDSLSQGFQSGAIFNTAWSYPAIIAYELGWFEHYRYPVYPGHGGLPLNIELLLRELQDQDGDHISAYEAPAALLRLRSLMDQVEDYWERGPGATPTSHDFVHDLAAYGWTLHDAATRTAASCQSVIGAPRDNLIRQIPEHDGERAALRVYPNRTEHERAETLFDTAARLGADGGIETLIVTLGANNALQAVIQLKVVWTDAAYAQTRDPTDYTVWDPQHFREELEVVRAAVEKNDAQHVIWATVPHVTIAPIARAVGTEKARPGSRYFPYYTRPWITDKAFDPERDPALTENEARAVDAAIDLYNEAITEVVSSARSGSPARDWLLFDLAGLLDRLATKRYERDPSAKPEWWTPYPVPAELSSLEPPLDTVFLTADGKGGRGSGGWFSLDGIHPTTVGYGLIADELMSIMRGAGVVFRRPDGAARAEPVGVDFDRLIERDSLITTPPQLINESLDLLGWADHAVHWVEGLLPHHHHPGPTDQWTASTPPAT